MAPKRATTSVYLKRVVLPDRLTPVRRTIARIGPPASNVNFL